MTAKSDADLALFASQIVPAIETAKANRVDPDRLLLALFGVVTAIAESYANMSADQAVEMFSQYVKATQRYRDVINAHLDLNPKRGEPS